MKALRQKVSEKNPDEFYFGMLSKKGPSTQGKKSTGTVNGDRGNQVLSTEAVRLLKTQDMGYVRTMRNKTQKEVSTLQAQLVGIRGSGKRVVFMDDVDEQMEMLDELEAAVEGSGDEDEDDEEEAETGAQNPEKKRLKKLQQKELRRLELRLDAAEERLKALTQAEEALDLQRAKMAKTSTVGGVTKAGVKYKIRERKR